MITMRELTDKAQTDGTLCEVFDFALPQDWVDEMAKVTGVFPYGFVWAYPNKSIWGKPFAVTEEAAMQLKIYQFIKTGVREY